MKYTEDFLVQLTTAEYLQQLGWKSIYAYNEETFGPQGLLGRESDREAVLTRSLRQALIRLNPGLPEEAYTNAVRQVVDPGVAQALLATNREKDALLRDGVSVAFRNARGELERRRLRIFDFETPANNEFLCVREFWIRGDLYRRRADIIGFVNGLPLLFIELKNVHKNLRAAYEKNLADYKETVPHLFWHNAVILLGNGILAKIGSLSSRYEHFHEWKRLAEEEPGVVDMETLLKGVCTPAHFMDLFENFILFDDSSGTLHKIVARNHQYLGVNRALDAVAERKAREGRLGVFWHTQGSGKSYSMVFFTRKVHRKLGGNFTFLICTDREDLDTQIYQTFAGCGVVDHDKDPCRAGSGEELRRLLGQQKTHIFTLIQKFNQRIDAGQAYSQRDDLIVISDEAHRTQYGLLAQNLRDALPQAGYIGFTGTPLFKDDEITRRVFGDYISTYDFQRAVDDRATVPLYYDARGDKLGIAVNDLNERLAARLEELASEDVEVSRLETALQRDYHILTAEKRLDQLARDFVTHYTTAWESGKAMLVCVDKITCVRMYNLIEHYWQIRLRELEKQTFQIVDEQESIYHQRQMAWMKESRMAVVVSEEQGEQERFREWGVDITPHRRLIKEGYALPDGKRMDLETAFKRGDHPFRIAIVCAMWLTGFDVPSLGTLYLDKPLRAHTLMQAIARANRIYEGKVNGLIVDYCGILKNLRQALATFAGHGDQGRDGDGEVTPAKPTETLLAELAEAIGEVRKSLAGRGASLDAIQRETSFARNGAIRAAKEAANENDESRQRFEILCRAVFSRFKSTMNEPGQRPYRADHDAIAIVYRSLMADKDVPDLSAALHWLHDEVDQAITVRPADPAVTESTQPYDISKIDFERLRQEFARSPAKHTTVQSLKQLLESRLQKMLWQNPQRINFQHHYEAIIAEYNQEKDRPTIEATFDALLKFVQALDQESQRALREGLDEETLAIYDLLQKPDLSPADIQRIKKVAAGLLTTLKAEKLRIDHWREKEATRDAVLTAIHNFLWNEATGLPFPAYNEEEVNQKASVVFQHVYRVYAAGVGGR